MSRMPASEHDCEFVLRYVAQVKPHWDDFRKSLLLRGFSGKLQAAGIISNPTEYCPDSGLMPTGQRVPQSLERGIAVRSIDRLSGVKRRKASRVLTHSVIVHRGYRRYASVT